MQESRSINDVAPHMIPPVLASKNLTLKALNPNAVEAAYVGWLNDPEINRFLESRFSTQTLDSVRDYVRDVNASADSYLFGIFLNSGGNHIGNIKLGPIDAHHHRADIGLLVGDKEQWGKGFATEAIAAIAEFSFGTLNLHKVTAGCYAVNEGSRRAFLRAGFTEVARRPDHWRIAEGWTDQILLELVRRP